MFLQKPKMVTNNEGFSVGCKLQQHRLVPSSPTHWTTKYSMSKIVQYMFNAIFYMRFMCMFN